MKTIRYEIQIQNGPNYSFRDYFKSASNLADGKRLLRATRKLHPDETFRMIIRQEEVLSL